MHTLLLETRPKQLSTLEVGVSVVGLFGWCASLLVVGPAILPVAEAGSVPLAWAWLVLAIMAPACAAVAIALRWLIHRLKAPDPLVGVLERLGADEVYANGRHVVALLEWQGRRVRVAQRPVSRKRRQVLVVEVACDTGFTARASAPMTSRSGPSVVARTDPARSWASDVDLIAMASEVLPPASGAVINMWGTKLHWMLPNGADLDDAGWRLLLGALARLAGDSEAHRVAPPRAPVGFPPARPSLVHRLIRFVLFVGYGSTLCAWIFGTVAVGILELSPLLFG